MTRISFHGGAGTVTGSKHLIEHAGSKLLVDCGLFQGRKKLRKRNWQPLPFAPRSVDALLLTHAHIDHSGYLPRFVKDGFRGKVFCTKATRELAEILLVDSAKIQEEDAEYANRKGFSRHKPALPLYTVKEAEEALSRLRDVPYDEWQDAAKHVRYRFVRAGHILGSGMVEMELEREGAGPMRLLLTGDVGRYDAPLVTDPTPPNPCDVLVVESTYGDRSHPKEPIEEQLAELLRTIRKSGGTALIPSFAVGRAQQLLYLLHRATEAHPELDVPVHLDSPMAVDTTQLYRRYPEEKGIEAIDVRSGTSVIYGKQVYLHRTRDESIRLNSLQGPRVIVSSSGMLSGGRVLHHLARLVGDPKNLVVLAGYQAPGTRGHRLQEGEETVRVHGKDLPVRAQVTSISGLSAHADRDQLLRWAGALPAPERTFVVHGEPDSAQALAVLFTRELGHHCTTPDLGDGYDL